jgi:hypothetical protein
MLVALVAGFVVLVNGPWLRVARVAAAGTHFTTQAELDALLGPYEGTSLLTIDAEAVAANLRQLPAVAEATVTTELPDALAVTITEKAPSFTWLTRSGRLVVAADGSIVATLPLDADVPTEFASLPWVDDQRSASRRLAVGDNVPAVELETARRLLGIDPKLVGSSTSHFQLRIDDEYGFLIVSHTPNWKAAMGFYQLDPEETATAAAARLEAQLAAIRTLFSTRSEAGISWVDARNPGKVYWAP